MATARKKPGRFNVRFPSSPTVYAQIQFGKSSGDFQCEAIALIVDESRTGCKLVFPTSVHLTADQTCQVILSGNTPRPVTVKWQKKLEFNLTAVGFQYED